MASIYKRRRSYPIPPAAKISERKRKATPEELRSDPTRATVIERYATWTDGKGRQRRGLLDETGRRVTVEARTYTIAYWVGDERLEVNSDTPDRDAAQQLANKLETEAMLRARGIIDATAERHATQAQRTTNEHLADFRVDLTAKGLTSHHIKTTCRHIETITTECKADSIRQLDRAAVMRVVGAMRDRKKKPASLRTCNSYLQSIKTFTRWLWKERRLPDDALAGMSAFNETTDRRHERRELQPDEVRFLLATVDVDTKLNYKLTGKDRAMAYRLALGTGFRVNELRSLTPASFDLDADPPTVTVEAGHSKRRRQDVQPIRQDLAALVRPWLAGRPKGERLFRLPHNTSKMFQRDLKSARNRWIESAPEGPDREQRVKSDFLKYEDSEGLVADFHAMRHTFVSGVVASGASVKTAQELARHSTPVLTIGRYSHARLHDLIGALDGLPSTDATEADPEVLRATGTDYYLPANRQQYNGENDPEAADCGESAHTRNSRATGSEVLSMSGLGDKRREESKVVRAGIEPATHGFSVHHT